MRQVHFYFIRREERLADCLRSWPLAVKTLDLGDDRTADGTLAAQLGVKLAVLDLGVALGAIVALREVRGEVDLPDWNGIAVERDRPGDVIDFRTFAAACEDEASDSDSERPPAALRRRAANR